MTPQRGLWLAALAVCLSTVIGLHAQSSQSTAYDLLIRGGRIVDGTGNPWFRGEVAIAAGRIAAVGRLAGARAARVIDVSGLVVALGFIDLHTHSDLPLLADGSAQSKVRQGVTLDVLGESTSVAPRDGLAETESSGGVIIDWTTFTGYFGRLEQQKISMNVATYVSYHQVRRVVMGYALRAATVELSHCDSSNLFLS